MLNVQNKAMSLQRKSVYFLSACAMTDKPRFAKMILALLGIDPSDKNALAKNEKKAKVYVPDPNDPDAKIAVSQGEFLNPRLQV